MASPELQMVLQMLVGNPLAGERSPAEMRDGLEAMAGTFALEPDVQIERVTVAGMTAEWITAAAVDPSHVILYLHGGGYVVGSLNTHRDLAARLGRAAGARVLAIEYRLAPEHPHPAAVDDAVAAYRWLRAHGVAPAHLAIAGDSAGGGLTVATLVALRDGKDPLPACAVCLSPWVDLEGTGESMTKLAKLDPMVQKDGLLQLAGAYLAGKDARTPLAAPLYANLSGLPPMLIQVGTWETLLDDASRLAERARKAGVEVTYDPWEGMIHVWQLFAPMLDEGKQAIEKIGAFVQKNAA